ncbi:MAG: argininosuccinate lyase, partial [Clostridia bacterium]|nr:argininosuccinate lyase [Clostridia bacterium]
MLKGLPLAYNKDMQEDKEAIFDSVDTLKMCLKVFAPMIETMRVKKDNMYKAAQGGFINATDMADYLVRQGLPFRSAYKISGQVVAYCIENGKVLDDLTIEELKKFSELFDDSVFEAISLETCVSKRISKGGTSVSSVEAQLAFVKEQLKK